MTQDGTCATGSRCSVGFGKLVWIVVPVAGVVVFMLIRGDRPPASSADIQQLQEKSPKLAEDLDRYAQPSGQSPAKSEHEAKPPKPPANAPAKPPEPQ